MKPVLVPPPMQFNNNALRDYLEQIIAYIPENTKPLPYTISANPMGDSKVDCTIETESEGKWHLTIELSPV